MTRRAMLTRTGAASPAALVCLVVAAAVASAQQPAAGHPAPAPSNTAAGGAGVAAVPLDSAAGASVRSGENACGGRYFAFLAHRVGMQSTRRAAASLLAAGFHASDVIIADTSRGGSASRDAEIIAMGVEIWHAPATLSYSQVFEAARRLAINRGVDWYFWLHADAVLLTSLGTNAAATAVTETCSVAAAGGWSMMSFFPAQVDVFVAFNTEAVAAAGESDAYIPAYKHDWDFYRRMELRGFHTKYGTPLAEHKAGKTNVIAKLRDEASTDRAIEDEYGLFIFDWLGRTVYFALKWGWINELAAPPFDDEFVPFASADSTLFRLQLGWHILPTSLVILMVVNGSALFLAGLACGRRAASRSDRRKDDEAGGRRRGALPRTRRDALHSGGGAGSAVVSLCKRGVAALLSWLPQPGASAVCCVAAFAVLVLVNAALLNDATTAAAWRPGRLLPSILE